MNKYVLYAILALILIGVATYFLGETGLFGGILGLLGLGKAAAPGILEKRGKALDEAAKAKEAEVKELQDEIEKIDKEGVIDKNSDQEKDYWKNQ